MSQGQRVYLTNQRINTQDINSDTTRGYLQTISENFVHASDFDSYMENLVGNGDTANGLLEKIKESVVVETASVYDLCLNSQIMTENDTRFRLDVNGRDGWRFVNDTAQTGSNIYWYSNIDNAQNAFNYSDVDTFYHISTCNSVLNTTVMPLIAVYSAPTGTDDGAPGFYHSRWTFSPNTQGYAYERVLYYYGTDPVNIHPELRHVGLTLTTTAPTGPRNDAVIYLMSLNTQSGQDENSIDYVAHETGFILSNGVFRSYQFSNSQTRLRQNALADLQVVDGKLQVDANFTGSTIDVGNFPTTQAVSNALIDSLSVTDDGKGSNYLNVHTDIPFTDGAIKTTVYSAGGTPMAIDPETGSALVEITNIPHMKQDTAVTSHKLQDADFNTLESGGVSSSIDIENSLYISIFGGAGLEGTEPGQLIVEFSVDNTEWFPTENILTIPSGGGYFSNTNIANGTYCVPYIRFRIAGANITAGMVVYVCTK